MKNKIIKTCIILLCAICIKNIHNIKNEKITTTNIEKNNPYITNKMTIQDKFLSKAEEIHTYIETNNYVYGHTDPISTKKINCVSYVTWILYELKYVDKIYFSCKKFYNDYKDTNNFRILSKEEDLQPGDIVFQLTREINPAWAVFEDTGIYISHVGIYAGKNEEGYYTWYDTGNNTYISTDNPIMYNKNKKSLSGRFAGIFRLKDNIDESSLNFENKTVTYNGTPQSILINNLPNGIKSVSYEGNNQTDAGTYNITAKFVIDEDNYKTISNKTAILTIEKANPEYVVPTNLTAKPGQTLKDIELPSGFNWETDETTIVKEKTNEFYLSYTPQDTKNYNIIKGIKVIVTLEEETIISPEEKTTEEETTVIKDNTRSNVKYKIAFLLILLGTLSYIIIRKNLFIK